MGEQWDPDRDIVEGVTVTGCVKCQGKVGMRKPDGTSYPIGGRSARLGLSDNRHLQHLAESITGNTGGPLRDDKRSE